MYFLRPTKPFFQERHAYRAHSIVIVKVYFVFNNCPVSFNSFTNPYQLESLVPVANCMSRFSIVYFSILIRRRANFQQNVAMPKFQFCWLFYFIWIVSHISARHKINQNPILIIRMTFCNTIWPWFRSFCELEYKTASNQKSIQFISLKLWHRFLRKLKSPTFRNGNIN